MTSTVAIMMVTYNRLPLTKKMMDNLFEKTNYPFRLIVVDNGSIDGTPEWLKEIELTIMSRVASDGNSYCIGYRYLLNSTNLGIGVGRNQALKIADEYGDEWLSTVDNDVDFPPNWLKDCIDIMEANPKLALGANMECVPYPIVTRNGKTFQLKPDGNLGTACTVFDRRLHNLIGFFITEYGLYGEEDADFFFRARRVGYELGYLQEMGQPFPGDLDGVEYRQFKDQCHANNLFKFRQNCAYYMTGQKPIYIPFE